MANTIPTLGSSARGSLAHDCIEPLPTEVSLLQQLLSIATSWLKTAHRHSITGCCFFHGATKLMQDQRWRILEPYVGSYSEADRVDAVRGLMLSIGVLLGDDTIAPEVRGLTPLLPTSRPKWPLLVRADKSFPEGLPGGWQDELAPHEISQEAICQWFEYAIDAIDELREVESQSRRAVGPVASEAGPVLVAAAQNLAAHADALKEAFQGDETIDNEFLDRFRSTWNATPEQAIDYVRQRIERCRDTLNQDTVQESEEIPRAIGESDNIRTKQATGQTRKRGNRKDGTRVIDLACTHIEEHPHLADTITSAELARLLKCSPSIFSPDESQKMIENAKARARRGLTDPKRGHWNENQQADGVTEVDWDAEIERMDDE